MATGGVTGRCGALNGGVVQPRFFRTPTIAGLVAIVAVAAALRLHGLAARPFWLDEAYSAYAADHGWRFLWRTVPTYETHPPFYYSLLHIWRTLFGNGLLALRVPGALGGIAAVAALAGAGHALGRALGLDDRRRGWLILAVAGLAALHPDLVIMSRQVRPYAVMDLAYAAALIPLMRLAAAGLPRPRGALATYAACEALMLWLHSLGPLFAGAMGLALLCVLDPRRLRGADWGWLIGSQLAAILIWLPAFLILRDQAPTWIASTWLRFRPSEFWRSIGLLYATSRFWGRWFGVAMAVAGLAFLLRRGREHTEALACGEGTPASGPRIAAALLLLALVPTAASLAITFAISPVFLTRTLSAVAMPAILLMALGIAWAGALRWAMLVPLAALVWVMGSIDRAILTAPAQEDWWGAVRFVRAGARPGDAVWFYPNESALPFAYAARDLRFRIPMRAVPTIVPSTGVRGMLPTGSRGVVSLYPDDISRLAATPQACAPGTLWLVRSGAWTYDKGDLLLNALGARRQAVGHWAVGPIEVVGLRRTRRCVTEAP